jgi:hypothetical protein
MTENELKILHLQSVALTLEKQYSLEKELERFHMIVNRVIKSILKQRIPNMKRTTEILGAEIKGIITQDAEDRPSPQYVQQYIVDVAKTARVEIGRHKKLARTVRSMRDKIPVFKRDRLIASYPIIRVQQKTLLLIPPNGKEIPIPFDKHSRNQVSEELSTIERRQKKGESGCERVRLTKNKAGYVKIDIRLHRD